MESEQLMQRCFELALQGFPSAFPNPLVGSVVVHQGKIIGEGYHMAYGGPHAEVNAINEVQDKSLLKDSTLYVNLEPCNHFGKTPPCSEYIIQNEIRRVCIASGDPNKSVEGGGIERLKSAGVEVQSGLLEQPAIELNKRFYTFHQNKRPWILLKWAQTADGFIGNINAESVRISNEYSRILVHKWRTEEQAILVGTKTALTDNPFLTAREWKGKNPLRLVIDRDLKLPLHLNVFDGSVSTLIFNALMDGDDAEVKYIRLLFNGNIIPELLQKLYEIGIQSVMVEGGAITLQSFINTGLWDEARVFVSNEAFEEGIKSPVVENSKLQSETTVQGDRLLVYKNGVL